MRLDDILDLAEKFHVLEYKQEGWSVVDWGCSCTGCYKHVHCCHMVLFGMMLNARLKVPEGLETAEPSLRKGRAMSRGTAGQKRKHLLAAIAAEKRTAGRKSRNLEIEGPQEAPPPYSSSAHEHDLCMVTGWRAPIHPLRQGRRAEVHGSTPAGIPAPAPPHPTRAIT